MTATETREVQVTTTATVRRTVTEQAPAQDGGLSEYYENCDEARAAGAAPVHEGDPGYGPHLDRDRDGVGCE
ncbi:excalibur calcium-binding domain-containing protein [Streptomonospora algeriensis]|uniref:Excalibur calcium-binding domain-containing protein n=1 Tax=Streptomonospora algeriensis TaxID=995084 RepID=A0ABW3BCR6_9ACTN